MKVYAVYRCLYGEDFAQASIRSIDGVVDKIFVFWDDTPWGDCDHVVYKGQRVDFPKKFDDVLERIAALRNRKVFMAHDHMVNNQSQFTHLINNRVLAHHQRPDMVMVIEIDHVFRPDQLAIALNEAQAHRHSATRQIEIWKGLRHRVPERPLRPGVLFWNMHHVDQLPPTGRQADAPGWVQLSASVHNMGFAVSEKVMRWKHLTAMAFSAKINDSLPNESWLEEKWMKWTPEMRDLEISRGAEHNIPCVVPYSDTLPPL